MKSGLSFRFLEHHRGLSHFRQLILCTRCVCTLQTPKKCSSLNSETMMSVTDLLQIIQWLVHGSFTSCVKCLSSIFLELVKIILASMVILLHIMDQWSNKVDWHYICTCFSISEGL